MEHPEPLYIGNRLELFVDDRLIDSLDGGASLRLHQPEAREIILRSERPWEGAMCFGYKTCFSDADRFRLYYQAWSADLVDGAGSASYRPGPIMIGYAESSDGISWHRPSLGLVEFDGSTDNNIVFAGVGPERLGVHGFAPFRDTRPDCPPEERYKALGAPERDTRGRLYALASPDGLRWSLLRPEPVMTKAAFDSQNLAFYDPLRGEYRAYVRDFSDDRIRGIKTCTSRDFVSWSDLEWLEYPSAPVEELYTNQIIPYPRAPHLYVGFPSRYVERSLSPTVEALPEPEHRKRRMAAGERYGSAVTDALFMASRDGRTFKRWDEAFLRPGLRPTGSWAYGDCYLGWGMLETESPIREAPKELSLYATEGYWRRDYNAVRRYALRIDGFVSVHAGGGGGELVTGPVIFSEGSLELNVSTSAAGSARVEIQSPEGVPIEGYTLTDCTEIVGDDLAFPVRFRHDPRKLASRPVRLRFVLRDADLYAYRWREI
jgi:hypothetical protein